MRTPAILTPDRAMYDYLTGMEKYRGKTITSSYLKLFVLLGTTGGFQFPVIEDGGTTPPVPGENRLPRSDAFWAMQMGFFIGKLASGQSPRSIVMQTFVNPAVFTDATEQEALRTLYNGQLKIEISNKIYYNKTDLKRFENVGVAQQGLNVSTAVANNFYGQSEFNPLTGMHEATPHLQLSGQSTPKIEVTLPQSVAMGGTAGTENYAIFYARGFYIADGANLGK